MVPEVGATSGALYIGIVVSITALPMLARIIEERGLLGSRVGTIALGAGALDDVIAWLGIGLMLTLTATGEVSPVVTALGFAVFMAVLFGVVRPGLRWFLERKGDQQDTGLLTLVCALLFASCAATEFLGLHVVIGAFALGLAFPKSEALSRWSASVRPSSGDTQPKVSPSRAATRWPLITARPSNCNAAARAAQSIELMLSPSSGP
jgi:Kef-type K+ transport system membrane component KefB